MELTLIEHYLLYLYTIPHVFEIFIYFSFILVPIYSAVSNKNNGSF